MNTSTTRHDSIGRQGPGYITAIAALILTGCGGGGGGGDSTVIPPPPPPPVRSPQPVVFIAVEPNVMQRHLFRTDDEDGPLEKLTPDLATANGNVNLLAVSPDGESIAYTANAVRDDAHDVFVMPSDGGTPVQVSSGFPASTYVRELAWSPDSSQLAYVANPQGRAPRGFALNEVFLADRDGTNNRKINGSIGSPPSVSVSNIRWSPDGRYVAQVVLSLDPFQTVVGLNTFDAEPGSPNSTRITPALDWQNGERIAFTFFWSPDSTSVLVRSSHALAGQTELYAVAADGSGATRLNGNLAADGNVDAMAWSPDGEYVAYWADASVDRRPDLFSVRTSDGTVTLLSQGTPDSNAQSKAIKWSPDSSQLLVEAERDTVDVPEIYVANPDGTGVLKLHAPLVAGEYALDGAWSPDGSEISFRSNLETGQSELFVVAADGGNQRKVSGPQTAGAFGVLQSTWSPDGSRIAYLGSQSGATIRELYVSTADGLANDRVNAAITDVDVQIDFFPAPRWSDDSTRILFVDEFDDFFSQEQLDLWVGTADGSAPIMLNDSNDFQGSYHY